MSIWFTIFCILLFSGWNVIAPTLNRVDLILRGLSFAAGLALGEFLL